MKETDMNIQIADSYWKENLIMTIFLMSSISLSLM